MNRISTVIIDDEIAAIDYVDRLCQNSHPELEIAGTATSIEQAIQLIERVKPELLFVDIEFPEGLGFEIISAFPDHRFQVVFVTAYDHYALKAIKLQALDYLLKPVDPTEFDRVVKRVIEKHQEDLPNGAQLTALLQNDLKSNLAIPTQSGQEFITIEDIIRVEADGAYSRVYDLTEKPRTVSKSLIAFEQVLEKKGFVRAHRKHLINPRHIRSYLKSAGGSVLMRDGSEVPLSKSGKELLRKKLQLLSEFLQ